MLEQNKQSEPHIAEEENWGKKLALGAGRIAGLGFIAAGSALGGAMLVPLDTEIGPHKAEVTLDFDGDMSGEVGGIGSIEKPVDLPLGLGVNLQLKEIPISTQENNSSEILSDADIEAYAQLMSEHEQLISSVKDDLARRARIHGAIGAAAAGVLYASYGKARRQELSDIAVHSRAVKIAAAAAITVSGAGVGIASAKNEASAPVSHVFDGTFLEGAQIRGKYMQLLVNEYGSKAVALLNEHDSFYDTAINNLRIEEDESPLLLKNDPRYITIDLTADRHCNFGMSRVIRELSEISPPDITLDAGDFTMGGTPLEEQCIAVAANYTEGDLIFAAGNHDSAVTEQQAKQHGFRVLDGKVIEVAGLKVLGDGDPMRSQFLTPAFQAGNESLDDVSHRLANTACAEEEQVDILLVHHKEAADEALARGCVELALSGHTHKFDKLRHPESFGIQIVSASSGGATRSASTFGPLRSPAEVVRIQFYKKTGSFARSQRIIIDEAAKATIELPTYGSNK